MMSTAVNAAVVLDVEAELLDHPNGRKYLRLVMRPEVAKDLREQLLSAIPGDES